MNLKKKSFRILFMFLAVPVSFALCGSGVQSALAAENPDPENLHLASVYAAVMDVEQGKPLYLKNAQRQVPIASITKLMTAMVVLDSKAPLNEYLTVHKGPFHYHKNAYSRIRVGSQLKRGDLMRLALMSSENLAATVLALEHPGGPKAFVEAMNRKAKSLGMTRTRFVDPSGLSPDNVSSAADLVKMVVASMNYPQIKEYSTTGSYTAFFKKPRYNLGFGNTNPLVHRSRWDVLVTKTGYLKEAGRCLVMLANIEGKTLAMVFLDSFGKRTPLGDAGRVKRWLTTGQGGRIAGAALNYERKKTRMLGSS